MTIRDAVKEALDDWASGPNFQIGECIDSLEDYLSSAVEDWCEVNGYKFDHDTLEWRKP